MLHLRVFGSAEVIERSIDALTGIDGVRQVTRTPGADPRDALMTATVHASSADTVLERVLGLGVGEDDVALTRFDMIAPIPRTPEAEGIVWSELRGAARANSRPIARYLAFMLAAGVIAGFGVVEDNTILTVGAMAVSPDLLPITAVCTGLVLRRARLVRRGLLTLIAGLTLAGFLAGLVSAALDLLDLLPAGFRIENAGTLQGLNHISAATVGVALAAGFAGMLATESRASAGVGVAISVTTIPAAAYLGVAAGLGELSKAAGALGVLSVNVAMLLLGGTLTLAGQRWIDQHRRRT